jgi:hypothetical protein
MNVKRKLLYIFLLLLLISGIVFKEIYVRLYHTALSYIQSPDKTYIRDKMWSYDSGFRVGGDFLVFKDPHVYRLQGDTIFHYDKPRALIVRLNKYLYQLTVSSIDGKQKGTYTNVEERLQ